MVKQKIITFFTFCNHFKKQAIMIIEITAIIMVSITVTYNQSKNSRIKNKTELKSKINNNSHILILRNQLSSLKAQKHLK